ncbi:MAG TPA: hypothetical protein VFW28_08460 [Micropepsaceae bacterium]|nr:hypothetical protein [Micropepsaceae bacterium]
MERVAIFRETAVPFRHLAATEKDEEHRTELLRMSEQLEQLAANRETLLARRRAREQRTDG